MIETAFSDEERELAYISRHLCPTALGSELAQLAQPRRVHHPHQARRTEAVMAEIGAMSSPHRIRAPVAGQ